MDNISKLCSLLENKKDRFLQYEQTTAAMLDCPAEDVEKYITKRAELATDIDGLDEEIDNLCARDPAGNMLAACANNTAEFGKVPPEYHCVFYGGQDVRSVVRRIAENEKQVKGRLERLKDEALESIKQSQNVPKIKKYLTNLSEPASEMSLTDEKA